MVTTTRLLPETLPLQRRRAAGLGKTVRTFALLLFDRSFLGFALIIGFGNGAMIGYIAGSSFVLEDIYGASPQLYSVLFGANALFLVMGAQINAHLLGRQSPRRLLGFGLTTMVVAAIALLAVVPFRGAGLAAVMPPLTLLLFQLEFHPVERLCARIDQPSPHSGNCCCTARCQPVRVRRRDRPARRHRRQRHGLANGGRHRHLRDRRRLGAEERRAICAATTGRRCSIAVGLAGAETCPTWSASVHVMLCQPQGTFADAGAWQC